MDASAILEVTRTLIGATEPYGDSGIDRERTQNLDKLIYIVDELLYDVEKVAVNKDRYEGSMRMMGEKAHKALRSWREWIDNYLQEEGERYNAPTIEPERKKGRWTDNNACPFCGFQPWYERDIHTLSFCPNCGADMRKDGD